MVLPNDEESNKVESHSDRKRARWQESTSCHSLLGFRRAGRFSLLYAFPSAVVTAHSQFPNVNPAWPAYSHSNSRCLESPPTAVETPPQQPRTTPPPSAHRVLRSSPSSVSDSPSVPPSPRWFPGAKAIQQLSHIIFPANPADHVTSAPRPRARSAIMGLRASRRFSRGNPLTSRLRETRPLRWGPLPLAGFLSLPCSSQLIM